MTTFVMAHRAPSHVPCSSPHTKTPARPVPYLAHTAHPALIPHDTTHPSHYQPAADHRPKSKSKATPHHRLPHAPIIDPWSQTISMSNTPETIQNHITDHVALLQPDGKLIHASLSVEADACAVSLRPYISHNIPNDEDQIELAVIETYNITHLTTTVTTTGDPSLPSARYLALPSDITNLIFAFSDTSTRGLANAMGEFDCRHGWRDELFRRTADRIGVNLRRNLARVMEGGDDGLLFWNMIRADTNAATGAKSGCSPIRNFLFSKLKSKGKPVSHKKTVLQSVFHPVRPVVERWMFRINTRDTKLKIPPCDIDICLDPFGSPSRHNRRKTHREYSLEIRARLSGFDCWASSSTTPDEKVECDHMEICFNYVFHSSDVISGNTFCESHLNVPFKWIADDGTPIGFVFGTLSDLMDALKECLPRRGDVQHHHCGRRDEHDCFGFLWKQPTGFCKSDVKILDFEKSFSV